MNSALGWIMVPILIFFGNERVKHQSVPFRIFKIEDLKDSIKKWNRKVFYLLMKINKPSQIFCHFWNTKLEYPFRITQQSTSPGGQFNNRYWFTKVTITSRNWNLTISRSWKPNLFKADCSDMADCPKCSFGPSLSDQFRLLNNQRPWWSIE